MNSFLKKEPETGFNLVMPKILVQVIF